MTMLMLAGVPREPLMSQPVRVQDGETRAWGELFAYQNRENYTRLYDAICKMAAGEITMNNPTSASTYTPTTDYNLVTKTYAATTITPLTTKGDLLGRSTVNARVPIGTDNQILTADAAQALGLKWADHHDNTNPAALGVAAPGTAVVSARRDHVHLMPKLDELNAPTDITTLNATTSLHGLLLKATAPAATFMNYVGLANGETSYSCKALFDATNPAALGSVSPGTATVAARRDHVHPLPTYGGRFTKLDIVEAALTCDGGDHDLDLSAVVPVGSAGVSIQVTFTPTGTTAGGLMRAKGGTSDSIFRFIGVNGTALVYSHAVMGVDASSVITYNITNGCTCYYVLLGYFS